MSLVRSYGTTEENHLADGDHDGASDEKDGASLRPDGTLDRCAQHDADENEGRPKGRTCGDDWRDCTKNGLHSMFLSPTYESGFSGVSPK